MAEKIIHYRFYSPTGLINQLMSFEIGMGLAKETGIPMIMHDMSFTKETPIYSPHQSFLINNRHGLTNKIVPRLIDIVDFKNDNNVEMHDEFLEIKSDNEINDLQNFYYSKDFLVSNNELIFSDGRKKLIFEDGKSTSLNNTLTWYSYFFFDRSKNLDLHLSEINFKQQYIDFAKLVSSSIGSFNGIHLRLSDHRDYFDMNKNVFENGLNQIEDNGLPIVLCTDEPENEMVKTASKPMIILDKYIINNFKKEFKELEFQDEVILGLVSNLIMHDSVDFVGNPSSTYSAYIHRKRNQKGIEKWKFTDNSSINFKSQYSWQDYNGIPKNWWREWKESKLNV